MENIVLEEFSDGFFLCVLGFFQCLRGFFCGRGRLLGSFGRCVCFFFKLEYVFLLINSTGSD